MNQEINHHDLMCKKIETLKIISKYIGRTIINIIKISLPDEIFAQEIKKSSVIS